MRHDRFHGRHAGRSRGCDWPGCSDAGEFRAPGHRAAGSDGPGDYRWFCLDHVREFNAGYDFFAGMSTEEILRAQSPLSGWASESRAFRPTGGVDGSPRWADFTDPIEAISARARAFTGERMRARARAGEGRPPPGGAQGFTSDERRALGTLGLGPDVDRKALRSRYSELVRRYHPDRNGGDRSHEERLRKVVEAYQLLRTAPAFA